MKKLLLLFLLTLSFTSCTKEDIKDDTAGWYMYETWFNVRQSPHVHFDIRGENYLYFDGEKVTKWIRSMGPAFGNTDGRDREARDSHKWLYSNESSCVTPDRPYNFNIISSVNGNFLTAKSDDLRFVPCKGDYFCGAWADQEATDGTVIAVKVEIDECSLISYYQTGL